MTDRYVVAGNPVAHSLSPAIHAMFAEATRQALHYDRLLCPLDAFEATIRDFAASAGARGCNVTVPFKFAAFALAARSTERARLAGAVNTLRFDPDGWFGDNTDGVGLRRDIEVNAGVPIAGATVLVLGAGGAAAGVLGPLLAEGPAAVTVANRTLANAQRLIERHRAAAGATTIRAVEPHAAGRGYDIVIDATAASVNGEAAIDLADGVLRPGALAVHLMYGPKARPFLDQAERAGACGRDGLGMLVEQAAEAFHVWRGVRPATAPVLAALRARSA